MMERRLFLAQVGQAAYDDHQPQLLRAFVAYHFCYFTWSIDDTVGSMALLLRTRGNPLRIV
jgi:hypothetical protein